MNSIPWFRTPERVIALRNTAKLWMGTPWVPNSCSRGPGGGVACHTLPAALYRECGFLPADWTPPSGNPHGTRYGREHGVIEPWLDSRHEFARVEGANVFPGDLLGFRFYHGIDHLGVLLCADEGFFVHVLTHSAVATHSITDPTWLRRLTVAWRPVES